MKSILDKETREEVINRINLLDPNSKAQWGKMTVYQMAKHMSIWNEWILGKGHFTYRQEFIGKIFGKTMLKKHTKDETPMSKGMPAGKGFTVEEKEGNLALQKKVWIDLIKAYDRYSNSDFIHDFYGKMSREQIGVFAYKHTDHHLRQFNN